MASRQQHPGRVPIPPALAVTLALLVLMALAALWFQNIAGEAARWRTHSLQVRLELSELRSDVQELSRAVRGYVASARDDWLEPGLEAQRRAPQRLSRLLFLTADNPAQQQRLRELGQHLQALIELDEAVVNDAAQSGFEAARRRIAAGTAAAELAAMKGLLEALEAEELRLMRLRDTEAQRSTNLTIAVTALGSLLSLVLVAWAGLGQQRSLHRLGHTVQALEQAQASLRQSNTRLQDQTAQTAELNEALWRSIGDGQARPSAAPAPQALDAPQRLEALRRTQLMDTPPEEEFDRFTRLAALTLHAPLCLISLVDERRQLFKSSFGLPEPLASARGGPVQESFCQFVVTGGGALVVEDAQRMPPAGYAHPVPAGVGAYLGVPLATPDGCVLGSFCVVDDKPRHWTQAERATMERIAQSVLASIAVRMQLRTLKHHVAQRTAEVALLAGAIKNSLNGVSIFDALGRFTYVNDAYALQFGYERPEQVVGVHVQAHCAQPGEAQHLIQEVQTWGACRNERTVRRRDGSTFEVLLDLFQAHDENGREVYVGTSMDITERKRAERALRLSEERLRQALEAARMGAFEYEPATDRVQRIGSLYPALGLDESVNGAAYLQRVHPEDRQALLAQMAQVSPRQPGYSAEYRLRDAGGGWAWMADHAQASFAADGTLQRQIGINMDVTARHQAEAALKAALAEKEVLLQEVHHRVKNNLQVVSSLLQLQRRQLQDPAIQAVLTETEQRVRAMALVHQRLYQQSTLSALDFADYLRTLSNQLLRAFGAEHRVRVSLALQSLRLPVSSAVPLGLIVTELVTNALKYAWEPGGQGALDIALHAEAGAPAQRLVLQVRDDGRGLPPGFDPARATGLGMRLVTLLSRQLDATVAQLHGLGTAWRVEVPLGADAPVAQAAAQPAAASVA